LVKKKESILEPEGEGGLAVKGKFFFTYGREFWTIFAGEGHVARGFSFGKKSSFYLPMGGSPFV